MKKNNESQVVEAELIPSTEMILRSGLDKPTLDRLVQQKVAEIMAERDALCFRAVLPYPPSGLRTEAPANGPGAEEVERFLRALWLHDL